MKTLERHRLLLWRIASDTLPTTDKLNRISRDSMDVCVLCNSGSESSLHLLKECLIAKMIWTGSPCPVKVETVSCNSILEFVLWILCEFNAPDKKEFIASACYVLDSIWSTHNGV